LVGLVPLLDTAPDLADNPWGDNDNTIGLTPDRLLGDLRTVFEGKYPDCRDHWHSNPSKMPDEVLRVLPRTVMVSATLDILHKSQVLFSNRLRDQEVEVDWMEADGIHQMKDMSQVTVAGGAVRRYVMQKSIEFAKHAKSSANGGADVAPTLKRQNAMTGLEVMASEAL
jgi:acetyl esterase/lipase